MSDAAPLPVTISVAAATDRGSSRFTNEDAVGVGEIGGALRRLTEERPVLRARMTSDLGFVLGVYDGCGALRSGETASTLAAEVVHTSVGAAPLPRAPGDLRERLGRAAEEANRRVFAVGRDDPGMRGAATTATTAALTGDRVYLASAGDSRAYLLRGRRLEQITQDDTLIEHLRRTGQLTPENAELVADHKNVITRLLGRLEPLTVEVSTLDPRLGDTLLLCTDGLSGVVGDRALRDTLLRQRDVGVACRVLVDAALRAGGPDNVSVIVARFEQLSG
jgi:PPM family protein phosphatase